jgi:hypothetical protein
MRIIPERDWGRLHAKRDGHTLHGKANYKHVAASL